MAEADPFSPATLPLRLNRFLAACGLGSRRQVERWIAAGRVRVNGTLAEAPGLRVQPDQDRVEFDGRPVHLTQAPTYLLLHKPTGVVSTAHDPHGRPTVVDLVRGVAAAARLYPVGRLDQDSEGLVLLTDDGTLTQRLLHPRHHVPKEYRVTTDPPPSAAALAALERGIDLGDGRPTRPARIVERLPEASFVLELREGRKRQIRRMCQAVGLRVTRLVRVKLGPLALGALPPGEARCLDAAEVRALWEMAGLERPRSA